MKMVKKELTFDREDIFITEQHFDELVHIHTDIKAKDVIFESLEVTVFEF